MGISTRLGLPERVRERTRCGVTSVRVNDVRLHTLEDEEYTHSDQTEALDRT